MANPVSAYSDDARDFLSTYKSRVMGDARLQEKMSVVQEYGQDWEHSYQLLNTFYAEAYRDLSFVLGFQWSLEEMAYLNNQRRSCFVYNKIRKIMNLIQGYQRKNRLASYIAPVEDGSEETAEIFTDVFQHIMTSQNGYELISDAFKNAIQTGICFLSPYMDYTEDPLGEVKLQMDEWNAVAFDPFVTKRSFADSTFFIRRKFLSKPQIITLIPGKEEEIERLSYGTRDDKFTYMPYMRQWGMQKLLNYNEYWKARVKMADVLVDMKTGETAPWKGDKMRLAMFQRDFPSVQVIRRPVPYMERGIIVEGQLLKFETNPDDLPEYPFVPFLAVWEPSYDLWEWKLQSLARQIRDPNVEINKRRSKMIDVLDSQLNSGWIAKTNSVSNPASLYKSGQGQVIFLKPEAQMADIQRLEGANIPPSMFQLEAEFEKDIFEIMGISPENVGQAENDKIETAGVLAKARQAAGWIPLQDVFDGLRQSQKALSEKIFKLIQIHYTPEKVQLITKKRPTPEFYSKTFGKYNVVCEEGVLTDTQKQSNFSGYLALNALGVLPPEAAPLIIKNSSLHGKKELQEVVEKSQQAAQQSQQMQMQLEQQKLAVESNAINARAKADEAEAVKRIGAVESEHAIAVERESRAEENRVAGVLNLIKAFKELRGMDTDDLVKTVTMLRELEESQREKEVTQNSTPSKTPG